MRTIQIEASLRAITEGHTWAHAAQLTGVHYTTLKRAAKSAALQQRYEQTVSEHFQRLHEYEEKRIDDPILSEPRFCVVCHRNLYPPTGVTSVTAKVSVAANGRDNG